MYRWHNYYTEIPLHSTKTKNKNTKKPQNLMSSARFQKIQDQHRKSIVILYTNNEQVETKIKDTLFIIVAK